MVIGDIVDRFHCSNDRILEILLQLQYHKHSGLDGCSTRVMFRAPREVLVRHDDDRSPSDTGHIGGNQKESLRDI